MMTLTETSDSWHLALRAGRVQMIQIDFRLGLLFADGQDSSWLHIETECKLKDGRAEALFVPEQARTVAPILLFFDAAAG